MLDGWYCRSLANEQEHATQQRDNNEQNVDNDDTDSDSQNDESQRGATNATVDYKTQYRYLKRKLKFLIYENEFFQDALRSNQRRLLKVSRDRAFLLDRLLQYEKPENTSSESEETEESSEDEATKEMKRRKSEQGSGNVATTGAPRGRKKKILSTVSVDTPEAKAKPTIPNINVYDNQQAPDIEKQLSKRPPTIDLIPERAVPTEMFSNEPSLDSEPTDHLVECSSPTHVAAEECVTMEYSN